MMFNRLKKLRVSPFIIEALLSKGETHFKVIESVLPNDVRLIDIITEHSYFPHLYFLLHSETWPELKDGEKIPEIESPVFVELR